MANSLTKVNSGGINDGSIVNADVKSDAAIALSKLASTPAVLTGSTNNTICTVTGANAIQGEGNLTFDGNNLAQTIDAAGEGVKVTAAGDHYVAFVGDSNRTNHSVYCTSFQGRWNGSTIGSLNIITGADNTDKDEGEIQFSTTASGGNETERLRIDSIGRVGIGSTDPVASTAIFGGTQNCLLVAGSAAPQVRIASDTANQADLILQAGNSGSDAYIANAASNGDLVFSTHNGSSQGTRLRILDDGGICFGSDTAAANALDDYEEGTWTPSLGGSGGDPTATYSSAIGKYTKIGNTVHLEYQLINTAFSGGSGNLHLDTLPFASSSGYYHGVGFQPHGGGLSNGGSGFRGIFINANSNFAYIVKANSDSAVHQVTDVSATFHWFGSLTYEVA